jgi:hypothetical protein
MKQSYIVTIFLSISLLFNSCKKELSTVDIPLPLLIQGNIAWLPFNGNANDLSSNGNNGIVNGAKLTRDRFGIENSAYSFDGIDDYIEMLNDSIYDLSSFTISIWYKANSYESNGTNFQSTLISKRVPNDNLSSFEIFVDNEYTGVNPYVYLVNVIGASTFDNTLYLLRYYNNRIITNEWYHVSFVQSKDSLKIYLNGELIKYTDIKQSLIDNKSSIFIGRRINGNNPYNGEIDDIGIWNRVLTDEEIKSLYNIKNAK